MIEHLQRFWDELENQTPEQVRVLLSAKIWNEERITLANQWLAHQASKRTSEDNAASLAEARAANLLAVEANASALEANSIARVASESAKRSAKAAWIANVIAMASAAAAMIAIVVSIIGLVHTDGHANAPKANTQAQTHRR